MRTKSGNAPVTASPSARCSLAAWSCLCSSKTSCFRRFLFVLSSMYSIVVRSLRIFSRSLRRTLGTRSSVLKRISSGLLLWISLLILCSYSACDRWYLSRFPACSTCCSAPCAASSELLLFEFLRNTFACRATLDALSKRKLGKLYLLRIAGHRPLLRTRLQTSRRGCQAMLGSYQEPFSAVLSF